MSRLSPRRAIGHLKRQLGSLREHCRALEADRRQQELEIARLESENDRLRGRLVERTRHWPELLPLEDVYSLTPSARRAEGLGHLVPTLEPQS